MLSREAVKQKLISWGIETPTEEQITDYLAQIGNEIKKSEDRATHYKAEAERVKSLESELDELKGQNMTEVEKLKKELDDATKRLSMSEKTVKDMQRKAALAEIGITGEDSEVLFENGELNTTKLGEILSNREKNAVAAYQKDTLNNTPAPQGGGSDEKKESPDVAYAKEYAAKTKGNDITQKVIDIYK
jgi:uncharacterized protein involved in exopolysaccharide biosynthesis